jgi:hypothetical protein
MASVPQTSIMLLLVGWFTTRPAAEPLEDLDTLPLDEQRASTRRLQPIQVPRAGTAPGVPSDIALDLSRMKFE